VTAELAPQTSVKLDHLGARELWGEADDWQGSVNDPRTREEHGIRFNEKWIYFLPDGEQRWVYWHRYQCRGVLVRAADGSVRREAGF
jgi:hypothetical protein